MVGHWHIESTQLEVCVKLETDFIPPACYKQSASSPFVSCHSSLLTSSTHVGSYNSVIFPVNPAYAYNIYQVTQEWADNGFQVPTSSLFKGSIEEPSPYDNPEPTTLPEPTYNPYPYDPSPYDYPESTPLPEPSVCETTASSRWSTNINSWVTLDTDPFFVKLSADAKSRHWKNLIPVDCIQAYNTELQTEYSNLFLVINKSNSVYGSLSGATQWPTVSSINSVWSSGLILTTESMLPGLLGGSSLSGLGQAESELENTMIGHNWLCEWVDDCNTASLISNPANWTFEDCSSNPVLTSPYSQIVCENASPGCWPRQAVEYCLAQPVSPTCSIQVSVDIMTIVIVFNSIKITCFVFTLWKGGFTPLVTLGDGMRSFLMVPDNTTAALAPISAAQVRKRGNKLRQPYNCPRCTKSQNLDPAMEEGSHTSNAQRKELFKLHPTVGLLASGEGLKSIDTCCPITSDFSSTLKTESSPIMAGKRRWFKGASLLRWLLTYFM